MSLAIEVTEIASVLLADGKWYTVLEESFTVDEYEFVWEDGGRPGHPITLHSSGAAGLCATGFSFVTTIDGHRRHVEGPLTAIVAVSRAAEGPRPR